MPKGYYTKQTKTAGSIETMLEEMTERFIQDDYKAIIKLGEKADIKRVKVKTIKKLFPRGETMNSYMNDYMNGDINEEQLNKERDLSNDKYT